MKEILLVFIGGGTGSVLRFFLSELWRHLSLHPRFSGLLFPLPTFIANIAGCFLIGLFYQYSGKWGMSFEWRLMLTTGLCGGFTTFSTLSYESMTLFQNEHYHIFLIYILSSIILGVFAVFIPTLLSQS